MTKEEIRNKVFELQKKISEWDNAYYNLDNLGWRCSLWYWNLKIN